MLRINYVCSLKWKFPAKKWSHECYQFCQLPYLVFRIRVYGRIRIRFLKVLLSFRVRPKQYNLIVGYPVLFYTRTSGNGKLFDRNRIIRLTGIRTNPNNFVVVAIYGCNALSRIMVGQDRNCISTTEQKSSPPQWGRGAV